MPFDPSADVFGKPFVELVKVFWHHEPVVPDVSPINNCERVGLSVFHRKTGKVYMLNARHRRAVFQKTDPLRMAGTTRLELATSAVTV
jgi:hypothetical protein